MKNNGLRVRPNTSFSPTAARPMTGLHERLADAAALLVVAHGEAGDFGELGCCRP